MSDTVEAVYHLRSGGTGAAAIIKQDGSREPFDEEKLRSGLLLRLEKRPCRSRASKPSLIRSSTACVPPGSGD